jgi:hypothetical protein
VGNLLLKKYKYLPLFLVFFTFFISSCSSYISVIQPSKPDAIILNHAESIGQSFVARYDGLDQIRFFIKKEAGASGILHFQLKQDSSSGQILYSTIYSISDIPNKGYFHFEFPQIKHSTQISYFASLIFEGQGTVGLGSADGAQYINGSAYRNQIPIDSQLSFQLGHQKWTLLSGLSKEFLGWLYILTIGIMLFSIPGWGILSFLLPGWQELDKIEKFLIAFSFTLALVPIIFLWVKLINFSLGTWLPISLLVVGFSLIFLRNWQTIKNPREWRIDWKSSSASLPFYVVFFIVVGGVIFTRFWVVRSLDLPLWGDSYHHSLIVQLLDDHKGLFDEWLPYADLYSLSYHYGFHASSVLFKWIVSFTAPQATQFMGQLLNIIAVMALYPLARIVGNNRWAGLAGMLFAGLLFLMPNSYTNWGRYTQLAGQVVLPSSILVVWMLIKNIPLGKYSVIEKRTIFRILLIGWIIWCGLALIHIRVAVFAAASIPVLYFLGLHQTNAIRRIFILLLLSIGSLVLFLPWLPNMVEGDLLNLIAHYVRTPVNSTIGLSIQDSDQIQNIFAFLPAWAWLCMFLSLGWGLWMRNRSVVIIGGWWLLVVLSANPGWLGLPGNGAITNFALLIALYIPAGILIGGASSWIYDAFSGFFNKSKATKIGFITLIFLVTIYGIRFRVTDIDIPKNALSVRPDIVAAEWINENIPDGSRFYVNSFFAYGGTLVVGSDGGWWLPLLANRSTTLPPLTYGIEPGPVEDYIAYVNFLVGMVQKQGMTDPDVIKLFREYGVTHIYIGQQQGSVNAPAGTQIEVNELLHSPFYTPIYHIDRVWIFELAVKNET